MVNGTIAVTATETTIDAHGFDPSSEVHAKIEWFSGNNQVIFNVDGMTNVDENGDVFISFPFGISQISAWTGKTFAWAKARIWDENLEIRT